MGRRTSWAALGAVALAVLSTAPAGCGRAHGVCDGREDEVACRCDSERRQPDGACCPGWTHVELGACVERLLERPTAVNDFGASAIAARGARVAIDDDGRLLITWIAGTSAAPQLYVAEETTHGAFDIRRPAAQLDGVPDQPVVVGGPGPRAVVAWRQTLTAERSHVAMSERDDSGAWKDPAREQDAFSFPPRAFDPTLLVTPRGETVLVYSQWFDKVYGVAVATKSVAGGWIRPTAPDQVLSPHVFFTNSPNIAAGADGEVMVSWYQALPTERLSAFASVRLADKEFVPARSEDVLSVHGGGDVGAHGTGHPRPAIANDGHAACAWIQADEQNRDHPFIAFRQRGSLDWQRPKTLEDRLGGEAGNAESVQIAYGANGTLYVVWVQDVGAGPVLLGLTRTKEGDWREDVHSPVTLSSPSAHATTPVIASGPDGAIVLAWIEPGTGLVLRRAWDDGSDWGPIEIVTPAAQKPTSPSIAVGRVSGRVVLAWSEGPDSRLQIATID